MSVETDKKPKVGLVLPGGGARAAYQVGVLKAIADILPADTPNPFPVISGISAGSINAVALATNANQFRAGVRRLHRVWSNFRTHHVYRGDWRSVLKTTGHWFVSLTTGGMGSKNPTCLLNNQPLRELLQHHMRFEEIQKSIDSGALDAIAVTGSGYDSARAVAFFQGKDNLQPWVRARREGRRTELNVEHMMGSVAVPVIFPSVKVDNEYFGDGAIRDASPLSPAVKLGADRLLVIGARDEEPLGTTVGEDVKPPSLGQIAGYMLDTIFLDGLYFDLERLTRINHLVAQVEEGSLMKRPGRPMKRIQAMIITPSMDVRTIAMRHANEFPRPVRALLRGVGAGGAGGSQLKSYLLFEKSYCRALMNLGYHDCLRRKDSMIKFLRGDPVEDIDAAKHLKAYLSGKSSSVAAD
ncbi:MAG: patatin-like phospholipase family protein [Gammaproteobacteria bacterium]|nr:patatin-like phospholipase family protein [Gammaproteobacteria bacterium]